MVSINSDLEGIVADIADASTRLDLQRYLLRVSGAQVDGFLRASPNEGRTALRFKVVGDTLLVDSRKWTNVVFNFRNHATDLLGAAGLSLASVTSGSMPPQVGNGILAGLIVWRTLSDARLVELDDRHACIVACAAQLRMSGAGSVLGIEGALRSLFEQQGWDFDRTVHELIELRVIHGKSDPFSIRLRERLLCADLQMLTGP